MIKNLKNKLKFSFEINKIIWFLVTVNFVNILAFQFFAPFFSIFVTKQIQGGTLAVVGFSYSIYWIAKSVFQLPIARYLDKDYGERDDYYALFFGLILASLIPIGYFFARAPIHIYGIQMVLGLSDALIVPAWLATFTRHVDKFRISFEWTLNSIAIGIAAAIAGAAGGFLSERFGFNILLIIMSIFSFFSALISLRLYKFMTPKKVEELEKVFPERK
ncbi:MAG: MFS transporter [Parcubacteria group bacterium]|nr:MFS transporter [Parcubacteria group bacterium]